MFSSRTHSTFIWTSIVHKLIRKCVCVVLEWILVLHVSSFICSFVCYALIALYLAVTHTMTIENGLCVHAYVCSNHSNWFGFFHLSSMHSAFTIFFESGGRKNILIQWRRFHSKYVFFLVQISINEIECRV